jgi:uncharacterized protein (TIGR04255 family)
MPRPENLPDYTDPPINEVVVGIQFQKLSITGAHIGAYWPRVEGRFPRVSEQPTLDPRLENFGDPSPPALPFAFALGQPESRFWFSSASGVELLQLQADRCLFNWRAVKDGSSYPHFEAIQARFWEELVNWREYASERSFELRPNQWEVTYVNRIVIDGAEMPFSDAFSFVNAGLQKGLGGEPEATHFSCQRVLLTETNQPWARGFLVVRMALQDQKERRIHLEFTVRGPIGDNSSDDEIRTIQLRAREWIVRAFDSLTSPVMHKKWGKR